MHFEIYPNMSGTKITKIAVCVTDSYADGSMSAEESQKIFGTIFSTMENRLKVRRQGKYTVTFTRGMGKKRLEIFNQLFKF